MMKSAGQRDKYDISNNHLKVVLSFFFSLIFDLDLDLDLDWDLSFPRSTIRLSFIFFSWQVLTTCSIFIFSVWFLKVLLILIFLSISPC